MRIQSTKTSNKKKKLIVMLLSICLIGAALTYIVLARQHDTKESVRDDKDNSKSDTNTNDDADGATGSSGDEGSSTTNNDYETIAPSESNPPAQNAPFPIETAEYRIETPTDSSFRVTLYPIEGSDYDAQLRNYKASALNYLKSRYSNLDRYSITWIPESAKDI